MSNWTLNVIALVPEMILGFVSSGVIEIILRIPRLIGSIILLL